MHTPRVPLETDQTGPHGRRPASTRVSWVTAAGDLAADAFLYAALSILVGVGVQMLITSLMSDEQAMAWVPPVWPEAIGALALPLGVFGGPLLAWHVHGHPVGWRDLLADVMGSVVGATLLGIAFVVLVFVPSFGSGPWALVLALPAPAAGCAAVAMDMRRPPQHRSA